jgi:hypothetical protein
MHRMASMMTVYPHQVSRDSRDTGYKSDTLERRSL